MTSRNLNPKLCVMSKTFSKSAQKAIKAAGGQTALAKLLSKETGKVISQWRVQKWTYNGIPPLLVLPVERVTGVPRWELRPDIYPRDTAA